MQITGRANYIKMTQVLGLGADADLGRDPEQAVRPAIAYQIMSVGMRKGLFTGKKLSDFIGPSGCDYLNARRIINGLDQAPKIAGYATTIETFCAGPWCPQVPAGAAGVPPDGWGIGASASRPPAPTA